MAKAREAPVTVGTVRSGRVRLPSPTASLSLAGRRRRTEGAKPVKTGKAPERCDDASIDHDRAHRNRRQDPPSSGFPTGYRAPVAGHGEIETTRRLGDTVGDGKRDFLILDDSSERLSALRSLSQANDGAGVDATLELRGQGTYRDRHRQRACGPQAPLPPGSVRGGASDRHAVARSARPQRSDEPATPEARSSPLFSHSSSS